MDTGEIQPAKADDLWPFGEESEITDLILLVEEKKIYVNKHMLILASPVFRKMLCADFKEKSLTEIPLPDKKVCDVVAFLRCIHPEILDIIDATNVKRVLPLADEYQSEILKTRCEKKLISMIPKDNCKYNEETIKVILHLVDAEKFNLEELCETCITCLYKTHSYYLKGEEFNNISQKNKTIIFRRRIAFLEEKSNLFPNSFGNLFIFAHPVVNISDIMDK